MMARNTNVPFKGRIQKRKTHYLQIITFGLQRAAGPYRWAKSARSTLAQSRSAFASKADLSTEASNFCLESSKGGVCAKSIPNTFRRDRWSFSAAPHHGTRRSELVVTFMNR
jgi:hypothetical protein